MFSNGGLVLRVIKKKRSYLDALVLGLALKEDVREGHLEHQLLRHLFLVPVPEEGSYVRLIDVCITQL